MRVSLSLTLVLTVLFFVVESLRAHPLLPLRMLRIRSLMVTSVVRGFMAMGLYGGFFLAFVLVLAEQIGLVVQPQPLRNRGDRRGDGRASRAGVTHRRS